MLRLSCSPSAVDGGADGGVSSGGGRDDVQKRVRVDAGWRVHLRVRPPVRAVRSAVPADAAAVSLKASTCARRSRYWLLEDCRCPVGSRSCFWFSPARRRACAIPEWSMAESRARSSTVAWTLGHSTPVKRVPVARCVGKTVVCFCAANADKTLTAASSRVRAVPSVPRLSATAGRTPSGLRGSISSTAAIDVRPGLVIVRSPWRSSPPTRGFERRLLPQTLVSRCRNSCRRQTLR